MEILPLILILIISILIPGIIIITKSKITGRKMPNIFQPFYDVKRLFHKGSNYSRTTSLIYKIAPIAYFSSIIVAVLFIPIGGLTGLFSFQGDFILFAYILAIGKFMMIIAALDTGSSFEGMGANREALYSMLAEPALFITLASLSLFTGNISFSDLYSNLHLGSNFSYVIGISSIYVLLLTSLVENSRMPLDDPKTHLELTMIHEVMVLDNSGFDLALIHLSTWIKFSIYGTLISNFIINLSLPVYVQIIYFFAIQALFGIAVGFLETFRARNKMDKNPQWIIMLSAIAIVGFLSALIISQKIILN